MRLNFKNIVLSYSDFLSNMFILGFSLERRDDKGDMIYINSYNNPVKDKYKNLWDESIWHKARRASKYEYPDDKEFEDYFPKEGILFMLKQLDIILINKLPDWSLFYILGEGVGRLNSLNIKVSEFEYLISKFPSDFISKYRNQILNLINDFNERELDFFLSINEKRISLYFVNRKSIT